MPPSLFSQKSFIGCGSRQQSLPCAFRFQNQLSKPGIPGDTCAINAAGLENMVRQIVEKGV
jgi:hypothetical protein